MKTLDQWQRELLEQVEGFVQFWEEQHNKLPDHYPLEMEAGDWDEQFDLFCEPKHE